MRRYVRFDTRKPAKARGLPLTTVVNRYTLLDILVDRCRELGPEVLHQGVEVAGYFNHPEGGVAVRLTDGTTVVCAPFAPFAPRGPPRPPRPPAPSAPGCGPALQACHGACHEGRACLREAQEAAARPAARENLGRAARRKPARARQKAACTGGAPRRRAQAAGPPARPSEPGR